MLLWIRMPVARLRGKPDEQFSEDTLHCTAVLGQLLPRIAARYSMEVLIPSLALHQRGMIRRAIHEGLITQQQAQTMVNSMLDSGDESSGI